jgi:hypothetical protein
MDSKQRGLSADEPGTFPKHTRRKKCPTAKDKVIHRWPSIDLIAPLHPKPGSPGGHAPGALETSHQIHGLSGPTMGWASKIDVISERIPSKGVAWPGRAFHAPGVVSTLRDG